MTPPTLSRKLAFASAVALFALALYPLDLFYWSAYGNNFSEVFIENIAGLKKDLCIQTANNYLGLIRYFHILAKPVYELPVLFLSLSVLFKMAEVFVMERILRCQGFPAIEALGFGGLFLFLNGLSGTAPNGIFGAPDFNKTFLSALFSLLGIYALLKQRPGWSGASLGLACYFHIPYGTTALVFVGTTQLVQSVQERAFRPLIRLGSAALITILPLLWQVTRGPVVENPMSVAEWYRFLVQNGIWGNDVLMTYSIFDVIFFFTTPLCIYLLLYASDPVTKLIDRYLITGMALTCLCLLLEAAHSSGIFLGKISEIFLSIQMRRGVWVPFTMLVIGIFRVVLREGEKAEDTWRWMLSTGALLFLLHSTYEFAVLISISLGIYLYRHRYEWHWQLAPLAIVTSAGLHLYAMKHLISVTWDTKRWLVLIVMVLAAVLPLAKPFQAWTALRRAALICGTVLIVWFAARLPGVYGDFLWLSHRGWSQPIRGAELLERITGQPESSQPGYAVLQKLKQLNPQQDVVFYPLSLDAIEGRMPAVFSRYWCQLESTYSYSAASLFFRFAQKVYGQEIDPQDLWVVPRMEKIHNSLGAERIAQMFDEGIMSFFISSRFYPELPMIARVENYYIYRETR